MDRILLPKESEPTSKEPAVRIHIPHRVPNLGDRLAREALKVRTGTYSEVFATYLTPKDNGSPLKVSYKQMRPSASKSASTVEHTQAVRHLKQLEDWMDLKHPHVVEFLGFATRGDSYEKLGGLVSKWYENGNVMDYLCENPKANRLLLLLDIAKGLSYLHECQIVHGNIKPDNVLIGPYGEALLSDYGLPHLLGELSAGAETSSEYYSVRYAAPELMLNNILGKEGDIYAFGCTSIPILFDQRPYPHCKNDFKVATAIHDGEPPWLWDVSSVLEEYLAACCSSFSETRPTALDLIDRLEDATPMSFKFATRLWSFNGTDKVQFSCSESGLAIWDNRVIHVTSSLPATQNDSSPVIHNIFHESILGIHRIHSSPDGTQVAWTLGGDDGGSASECEYVRPIDCRLQAGFYASGKCLYIASVTGEMSLETHHHDSWVVCIAWKPYRTNAFASGCENATVWIWQGAQSQVLRGYHGTIHALTWSCDGHILAAMDDQNVVLHDGMTFGVIRSLGRVHPNFFSPHLAFSRDGRLSISYFKERAVEIYDDDFATLNLINIEEPPTQHLATPWSHNSEYLAFQTEQGIHIYDGQTFKSICTECTRFPLIRVEWHPSTLQLVVLDSSKQLSLYKFIDRRPEIFLPFPDAEIPVTPERPSRWKVLPLWMQQLFRLCASGECAAS